ncbi:MAG: glycerol-3-phosphate dehydrogenase [Pseudomonadota bacterium]|nr:glycerol-3-phosphate dehydrogenase [Pseudomonadota bacterium]MED5423442.1 glycerol-3-phosphate dehydrogenase [Pseudomonadota bacterium]
MVQNIYDIVVIGGGINGMGIARDAAGRGLSVLLLEQNDFASATSSASSKLIHGGLRYLEYYEFGLVRAALKEREVLLAMAPHIIWPLNFILPHSADMRPAWLVRMGLFLYDHLGGRKVLKASKSVKLDKAIFKDKFHKGFSYADCWTDDARLVVLNAMDAEERGAHIYNYTPCIGAKVVDGLWQIEAGGALQGVPIQARQLVNAAGPWVRSFLDAHNLADKNTRQLRLVKGSHIIVPKLFDGDDSYILQQPDGRIVFALPYVDDYTLIGTTDVEYEGDPSAVHIDADEIDYLCAATNRYFRSEITADDVVSTYSGVRPLLDSGEDNASAVTRDYILDYSERSGAPLLSIFGGKITTYRTLAEKAVSKLSNKATWTAHSLLPGALINDYSHDKMHDMFQQAFSDDALEGAAVKTIIKRWRRQYGSRSRKIFDTGRLGRHFGHGLYQAEVDYLCADEYAQCAADILWRRTKLGLKFDEAQQRALEQYIKEELHGDRHE